MPKSNITIILTPIFEWYVVRFGSKNEHQKDMCLKGLTCLNYVNHFRRDNQHDFGDLYEHSMSM